VEGPNLPSMEDAFLQAMTDVVYANLSNEHFGAKELAKEVGLSRSQIHRKLHRINGKSITQFIREIRLEQALKLLNDNVGTVAEISYYVGFSSPTYFNKCFHEYFGYPPGRIKKKNEIINELNKSYLLHRFDSNLTAIKREKISSDRIIDHIRNLGKGSKKDINTDKNTTILFLMIGLLIIIIFLIIGTYFI